MIKDYRCYKCDTIFSEEGSDKFIKTTLRKCPNCGSNQVSLVVNKKMFAKHPKK